MLLVRNTSGSWTSTTVGLNGTTTPARSSSSTRSTRSSTSSRRRLSRGEASTRRHRRWAPSPFPGRTRNGRRAGRRRQLNNSTSTKQNVSPATGLVVLASSGQRVYFHQYFSLGGSGGGGSSPTAAFSATPTSGAAPLGVQFTDASSGGPTAWQWDFENDGTVDSTQQNPSFVYANPGTYSVKLTVSNASGDDSVTKSSYITVTTAGPTLSFTPTDDAFVRSNHPDENNGSLDSLRSWKGSGQRTPSSSSP